MTETTQVTLSVQTQACVEALGRARHEVEARTANLQRALLDDVEAGRLTDAQADEVAMKEGVDIHPKAPQAAEPSPPAAEEAPSEPAEPANESARHRRR